MTTPSTYSPETIKILVDSNRVHMVNADTESGGIWVPLRPQGFGGWSLYSLKLRCTAAWKVFLGKADIVVWHNQ